MSDPHFKTPMDAIGDLLVRAWKYDDKPHQLFSCIRAMAEQYQSDEQMRAEIVRLMEYAYQHAGAPAPIDGARGGWQVDIDDTLRLLNEAKARGETMLPLHRIQSRLKSILLG